MTESTKLVVLMCAQNELGTVYPVQEVARRVAPVPVFCDAVQALGKIEVDVSTLGVAAAVFSAHKIGGLSGVGALWTRRGVDLRPRTVGGAQERGERGGTENLLGVASFGLAISRTPERRPLRSFGRVSPFLIRRLSGVLGFTVLGPVRMVCLTRCILGWLVAGDLVVQSMDLGVLPFHWLSMLVG